MTSDRPSRRLQATRQAPRRATPCQDSGPPDCLRKLRQTGSVASVECSPLRSRPHSATAPFAPKQRGPRAAAPLRAAPCRDSPPPDCLRKLRQTGSVPLAGLVTLCYRLRGGTGRLGYRPACRVPALRWSFPPPIDGASGIGLPPLVFDPPPGHPSAPKGLPGGFVQALWLIGTISAPAFSLSR